MVEGITFEELAVGIVELNEDVASVLVLTGWSLLVAVCGVPVE